MAAYFIHAGEVVLGLGRQRGLKFKDRITDFGKAAAFDVLLGHDLNMQRPHGVRIGKLVIHLKAQDCAEMFTQPHRDLAHRKACRSDDQKNTAADALLRERKNKIIIEVFRLCSKG